MKLFVPRQLPCQPEKRLFNVVPCTCRNIVILQVLLSAKGDLLRLDLTVLDVYLVPHENDWDVSTNALQVAVPVGNVFVGGTGVDVEHDYGALALNEISITQSTEFLLTGTVQDFEFDRTSVRVKDEGVDLDSEGGGALHILFELTSRKALEEGGFAHTAVADEHELDFWHIHFRHLRWRTRRRTYI